MNQSLPASVIIPTHERRASLERALRALGRQTAPAGSFEVVVALDGSTDGTAEMVEGLDANFPLRAVSPARRGRAAARNAALDVAAGRIVILIDDDMEPAPEFVEHHLRHHRGANRKCVLGAVPVRLDASNPRAARYVRDKFAAHLDELAKPGHVFGPRDFYSGNASLSASLLREVGAFDESFTPYGNEDVELSVRLRKAGVTLLYDPAALAWQEYDKDLRGLAGDTLEKGRTTVQLARRHPDAFPALRLAAPRHNSRPWLAARSLLLRLTRLRPGASAGILSIASALERLGCWRSLLFYRAVLDYAFWAGVGAELSESDDDGDLAELAADLKRGPIDLLLHG